jgi:hypothetical protein
MIADLELPLMRMVHQHFHIPPKADGLAEIDRQWERIRTGLRLPRGSSVAVAVGSRGIANLTSINCLTCCCPESGKIPLTYPNDKEAIAAAMMTLRPYTLNDVKIAHIKNTMDLVRILVSKASLPHLENKRDLVIGRDDLKIEFDGEGNLRSQLGSY